jgi:hypothetical protein
MPRKFVNIDPAKIETWLAQAERLADQHPDRPEALAKLCRYRIDAHLRSRRTGLINVQDDLESLRKTVEFYLGRRDTRLMASTLCQIGEVYLGEWFKSPKSDNWEHLTEAYDWFQQAIEVYEAIGARSDVASAHGQLAAIQWEISRLVSPEELKQCILNALKHLRVEESINDKRRQEISALPGLTALRNKQFLTAQMLHQIVYTKAVRMCCSGRLGNEAWEWIQKNKARSMSDLLGMGSIIPSYLDDKIRETPEAVKLLQRGGERSRTNSLTISLSRSRHGQSPTTRLSCHQAARFINCHYTPCHFRMVRR